MTSKTLATINNKTALSGTAVVAMLALIVAIVLRKVR